MKKLLLSLILCICFTKSYSQTTTEDIKRLELRMEYAGENLEKAGDQFLVNSVLMIAGATAIAISWDSPGPVPYIGVGVVGLGFCLNFYSFGKIYGAGRKLRGLPN